MRPIVASIVFAALLSGPAFAKPREVRRLQPAGKWVLNYADESCQLVRDFGTGDQKVTLVLYQLEPGDWFKLTLLGSSLKPARLYRPFTGRMQFGPAEADTEITVTTGTSGSESVLMLDATQRLAPLSEVETELHQSAKRNNTYYQPAPIGSEREKAATWLALSKVMKFDLVFETGPMDAAMAALRDCTWDLVDSWGLDVAQQKALTRKAYAAVSTARWFRPEDYPMSMIRSDSEGIVNARLLIDASGKPESCNIQSSTRPKEFDAVVCDILMKRSKFHPALDAQGKPIRSYYQITTVFRLAY